MLHQSVDANLFLSVLKTLQQLLGKQDESQLFASYTILDSVKRYFQELTGLKATQRASFEPSGEGSCSDSVSKPSNGHLRVRRWRRRFRILESIGILSALHSKSTRCYLLCMDQRLFDRRERLFISDMAYNTGSFESKRVILQILLKSGESPTSILRSPSNQLLTVRPKVTSFL